MSNNLNELVIVVKVNLKVHVNVQEDNIQTNNAVKVKILN